MRKSWHGSLYLGSPLRGNGQIGSQPLLTTMRACTLTFLLVLLAIGLQAKHHLIPTPGGSCSSDHNPDFDFFLHVRSWSVTLCKQFKDECVKDAVKNDFTLHGVWPNRNNGTYPAFCDGAQFDWNNISDLKVRFAL